MIRRSLRWRSPRRSRDTTPYFHTGAATLQSVTKKGTRITTLVTSKGKFTAKVFIDAIYEGDLMASKLRERLLAQKQLLDLPVLANLPPPAKRNGATDPAIVCQPSKMY